MKRDQFTFYRSYYEALKHLPKRDRADVLMAVIGYALDEEIPKLSGVPLSVFTLIRPTLDSGRNKAKNRLNKQKTNQEQTGTKQEQNGKEGESEREVEKELEREVESECEGEGENDSSLPPTPLPRSGPVAEAVSDYLDRINPSASAASLEELGGYAEAMGAAVGKRAFDIALDSKKANWPYIRAILRDKQARGVRCLADWDALEAEHRTSAAGGRTDWAALAARMDAEEGTG